MTASSNVEDIHRLTELQETMLMHRLQRQEADSGILLVRATLVGDLDVERFRAAWQATLAGHPAARSSVHWQELKHPVQVVARDVPVDIEFEDCSNLPAEQQQERLVAREQRERVRGLDVDTAPVMRWSLARTAEREHHLLWVCHHLLLDGWSSALLLDEVIERYDGLAQDRPFAAAAAPRFRDWVTWLSRHDEVDPAELWAKQGFRLATPIAMRGWHEHATRGRQEVVETLASFSQLELDATARNWQLSPASLYLGCWGLSLAETTGSMEAVFGFTASGRSADFDGVERLVGMLANTLPFTVQVESAAPVADWFRRIAASQHDVQRFERCSLGALLRAGGYVARRPLFDTLLTVANYPGLGAPHDRTAPARALALQDFDSDVMSGYPLTLAIVPGAELRLRAVYQPEAVGRSTAEAMLARFERIVCAVVSGTAATVGDLLVAVPENQGQVVSTTQSNPKRPASPAPADAPMSAVERQLVHIWLALLDVPDVGLDETFFALGGNSILVPAMIERVQQDFGVELPLGAVFATPTVRALAKIIEAGDPERSWHCVVPIRESGSRPPLYLMHYLEGSIGHYYNLANRLPHDQPVFGVQAPSEPLTSIEGMAARYLEEIRARQPHGPYQLGGFCIGGMLAFEVARQLSAEGETVPPLILLDCVAPGPLFAMSNTVLPSTATLARMALADPQVFVDRVAKRLVRSAKRLGRTGEGREAPVELNDVRDLSTLPQAYLEPSMCHFRAGRDYRPDPWDGDAILLRTDDERFGGDLGWRPFIKGKLDITVIPGSHVDTLQEPTVKETGRLLAAALDQATQAPQPQESPEKDGLMEFGWTAEQDERFAATLAFARDELSDDLRQRDDANQFSHELWQRCAAFGVLGWCMPEELGGSGLDIVTTVRLLEAIGHGCRDNGLTLGLNGQIWAVQEPLLSFGNDEQKAKYLPCLCSGELMGAHGMSEPNAGSDAFSLETSAVKVDGGYVLNGHKSYIGLSPEAGLCLVFATTNPAVGRWGLTAFLVESSSKGYTATPARPKMGLKTNPLGDVVLEDCFVPEANRLGPEGSGASIFSHSMEWERSFIFASHVGAMARQLDDTIRYAQERNQYGQPIGAFQSVANRVVEMKRQLETSRLLLYKLAWLKDQKRPALMEAALAKLHLGEAFAANSLDAMRIHGAKGYLAEFEVERDLRDFLGGVIYSGTSDIQRNIIARILGL